MELNLTFVLVTAVLFQCLGNVKAGCYAVSFDVPTQLCLENSGKVLIYCRLRYCYDDTNDVCRPIGHTACTSTCTGGSIVSLEGNCDCIGPTVSSGESCIAAPGGSPCPFCTWSEVCSNGECYGDIAYCYPNPCLNEGDCTSNVGAFGYNCTCPSGWTGNECEMEEIFEDSCNPNPCLNGGVCTSNDAIGYTCACKNGYGGDLCDVKKFGC